jgi:hypothetical protein
MTAPAVIIELSFDAAPEPVLDALALLLGLPGDGSAPGGSPAPIESLAVDGGGSRGS